MILILKIIIRILKYMIVLFVLGQVFRLIYNQSNYKGFKRWVKAFPLAVIVALALSGLIAFNEKLIEKNGLANAQVPIERLVAKQELGLLENNAEHVILVKNNEIISKTSAFPLIPGRTKLVKVIL